MSERPIQAVDSGEAYEGRYSPVNAEEGREAWGSLEKTCGRPGKPQGSLENA
jgi:hypothetical protein